MSLLSYTAHRPMRQPSSLRSGESGLYSHSHSDVAHQQRSQPEQILSASHASRFTQPSPFVPAPFSTADGILCRTVSTASTVPCRLVGAQGKAQDRCVRASLNTARRRPLAQRATAAGRWSLADRDRTPSSVGAGQIVTCCALRAEVIAHSV